MRPERLARMTWRVEAGGHEHGEAMRLAVDRARAPCQELMVLGSYPRSRRVLA